MRLGKDTIIGNEKLCAHLYNDISSGTLAHAYIIEGKSGSGRRTIAKHIIAALACMDQSSGLPCGKCKNCRDIFEDKCPDVMTIGRDGKSSLGIEAVRNLKSTLMAVGNNLDFKAYILEDADTMTVQAQNAFLLTLEQPPTRVYFFIICENSRSLLETIRSRAQLLRTEPQTNETISAYIMSDKVDKCVSDEAKSLQRTRPNEYEALLFTANGSIGRAIELLDPKIRKPITDSREFTIRFISSIRRNTTAEHPLMMFADFPQKRDDAVSQLEYFKIALRDLVLLKKSENAPLCFFTDREDAIETSSHFSEKRLMHIFDKICDASDRLSSNANVRLTLTNFLSDL